MKNYRRVFKLVKFHKNYVSPSYQTGEFDLISPLRLLILYGPRLQRKHWFYGLNNYKSRFYVPWRLNRAKLRQHLWWVLL